MATRNRDAAAQRTIVRAVRRWGAALAGGFALQCAGVASAPASAPGPDASPTPCDASGARLELQLSADPAQPRVGDAVALQVVVTNPSGGLAGLPAYSLSGAEPIFTAELVQGSYPIPELARYRLLAKRAGRAELRASVHYETSHDCFGYPIYFFRSSTSAPFVLEVGGATPTATPTGTPPPTPTVPPAACPGDCDGDRRVSVADLVRGVAAALGRTSLPACPAADADGSGGVTIDDLIAALRAALDGCAPARLSAA